METFYRQCSLKNGNRFMTTWIPESLAETYKVLKLKKEDGTWENGWVVIGVYHKMHIKHLLALRDEYRSHRDVTDK